MYDALNLDFNSRHRLGICRPRGIVDEYLAAELLNFLLALEEVADPFNRVLDLTLATCIPLTTKGILEFAESRRGATAHLPQIRTAIIASGVDAESLARIYAMLMKDSKIEVGIFPDTSSAAQWLGVPKDAVRSKPSPTEHR